MPPCPVPPQTPLLISSQRLCFEHWSDLGAYPRTGAGTGKLCQRPQGAPQAAAPRAGTHLMIRSCDGAPCRPCRPWGRQSRGPSGTVEKKGNKTKISHKTNLHVCHGPGSSWRPSAPQPSLRSRGRGGMHPALRLWGTSRGSWSCGFTYKIWPDGCGQTQTHGSTEGSLQPAFNEI